MNEAAFNIFIIGPWYKLMAVSEGPDWIPFPIP